MQVTKTLVEREALLLKIKVRDDVSRVLVCDTNGKQKYRTLDEIKDSDHFFLKSDGQPVLTKKFSGRPTVSEAAAKESSISDTDMVLRRKTKAINSDPILKQTKSDPDSINVLQGAIVALTEEASSIAFERTEAERKGQDTSNLSLRRVAVIKTMVETWLKYKDQIASKDLDLHSPAFLAVFKFLVETFKEAMSSSRVEDEMIDIVLTKVQKVVEDPHWEAEAKNHIKTCK